MPAFGPLGLRTMFDRMLDVAEQMMVRWERFGPSAEIDVADNMKKYGGFIPGIRAGRPTAEYLSYVLNRITLPGAIYVAVLALLPLVAFVLFGANQNFPLGGASLLIVIGVGLDTVKQIDAQLQQRNYEGLLR